MSELADRFMQIITEPDNKTICIIRVTTLVGIVQGLGLHAWSVFIQHAPFNLQEFGIGLGAILATAGAALGMKKDSPAEDK